MNLGIEGRRALITGASRGLGRAIAFALAKEGVKIAVVARDTSALWSVVEEIGGQKQGHYGLPLDLMAEGAIELLKEKLQEEFGAVEIIVHNLGGTLGVKIALSGMADYQRVWQFNMGIAVEINRIFLPSMVENNWGRIVHISSSAAVMIDASLPYSSAKAALNAYIKGLGREVAGRGIIVSGVMPGPFMCKGGHWDKVAQEDPERVHKFISERMAVRRLGSPEEISGVVAFLCSEQASFCAGAILPVDGGIK